MKILPDRAQLIDIYLNPRISIQSLVEKPQFSNHALGSALNFTYCHSKENGHRYHDGVGSAIDAKGSIPWHSIQCGHDRARTSGIVASDSKRYLHIRNADTARQGWISLRKEFDPKSRCPERKEGV